MVKEVPKESKIWTKSLKLSSNLLCRCNRNKEANPITSIKIRDITKIPIHAPNIKIRIKMAAIINNSVHRAKFTEAEMVRAAVDTKVKTPKELAFLQL